MKLHSALICVGVAALVAGCGKPQQQQQPQQMPPTEVGVITAKAGAVPLTQDIVGRLSAVRTADVRARVPGVLQKRVYTEGTDVKEGQVLFEIDPAPLRASLNAQLANLASAQATYTNNHVAADRARSVGAKGLLSKADIDAANAAERTSAAAVKQAQATVDSAKINLGYAHVTAPISGRAGQQQVTEGALVGQGDATLLTTIDQIDSLYINFTQAIGILDDLRRAAAGGSVRLAEANKAKVEILHSDGSTSGATGTLDFSDTSVDAATGAVSLRAVLANPDRSFLPGQYVNVRLTMGDLSHAWLILQQAVQRDASGPYVFVVGSDGKVVQKRIKADTLRGDSWIVTDGLADGDQVIVSGVMKVKPGAPAKATPYQPGKPADGAAAAPGAAPAAKPAGDQPAADKSAPNKPAGDAPAAGKPASDQH
jgi:membrane fusion protein (multidrug efflux system)